MAALLAGCSRAQVADSAPAAAIPPTTPTASATASATSTPTPTSTLTSTSTSTSTSARARVQALLAADPDAQKLALDLLDTTGDEVGLEREHTMDGGYRGMLHLVPAPPTGAERVHLERVAHALADYDRFFAALGAPVDYRWRHLSILFFRSVHARTPSAYAHDWTIAYNVDGSLNHSDDQVRETLFHEIFHLDDAAHEDWSARVLGADYEAIVKRCGTDVACLTPYAPNRTMVRGGTYYAFQPGNDVREYAAELAIRYYREERGALGHGPRVTPRFACTSPPENRRAWRAIVAEFFHGIDRQGPCPGP